MFTDTGVSVLYKGDIILHANKGQGDPLWPMPQVLPEATVTEQRPNATTHHEPGTHWHAKDTAYLLIRNENHSEIVNFVHQAFGSPPVNRYYRFGVIATYIIATGQLIVSF